VEEANFMAEFPAVCVSFAPSLQSLLNAAAVCGKPYEDPAESTGWQWARWAAWTAQPNVSCAAHTCFLTADSSGTEPEEVIVAT